MEEMQWVRCKTLGSVGHAILRLHLNRTATTQIQVTVNTGKMGTACQLPYFFFFQDFLEIYILF